MVKNVLIALKRTSTLQGKPLNKRTMVVSRFKLRRMGNKIYKWNFECMSDKKRKFVFGCLFF